MSKKLSSKKSLDTVLFVFSTESETLKQLRNIKNLSADEKNKLNESLRLQQGVSSSENFVVYYSFILNTLKTLNKLITEGESKQVLKFLQNLIDLETDLRIRQQSGLPKKTAWRSVPKIGINFPGYAVHAGFPMNPNDWFSKEVLPKSSRTKDNVVQLDELVFPGDLIITSDQIKNLREFFTSESLRSLKEKQLNDTVITNGSSIAKKSELATAFGVSDFPELISSAPIPSSPVEKIQKINASKSSKSSPSDTRIMNPFEILASMEEPLLKALEKPIAKPTEKPTEKPIEKPLVKANKTPAEKAAEKAVKKPIETPVVVFEIRHATESDEKITKTVPTNWANLFVPSKITQIPQTTSGSNMYSLSGIKQ